MSEETLLSPSLHPFGSHLIRKASPLLTASSLQHLASSSLAQTHLPPGVFSALPPSPPRAPRPLVFGLEPSTSWDLHWIPPMEVSLGSPLTALDTLQSPDAACA